MTHDVVILGGGPAGAATARRLAIAGARVALVGGESRAGIEGLSTRSHALLAQEGLEAGSDALAGPYPRDGHWTAGRTVAGGEWLTERRALARALRRAAVAAGVHDYPFHARDVRRDDRMWQVRLTDGSIRSAPIVIEARGRRGPEFRGPVLLAIGQRFRAGVECRPGTHLEAVDDGWCWWVAQGRDIWVQVVGRPRVRHPGTWIGAAIQKIGSLSRALRDAAPVGRSIARPAHARLGLSLTGGSSWSVGDSAMALDPLSGQGVYEALRSARLVATAVKSISDGGDAGAAQRFVAERTEEAWRRGVALAAGFYGELADRSAFWAETAHQYEVLLPAAPNAAAVVELRPVLIDGRIVEREVLVGPGHPRGVWHVKGVPLVALKRYLEGAHRATVCGAANALAMPPDAVAAAIQWLQTSGLMHQQGPGNGALGG